MDIATQVAVIRAGLWNPAADPLQGAVVLPDSAKLRVVNWPRVRTALEILASKDWVNTTAEWKNVAPYLNAPPDELILEGNNEVQGFRSRIVGLKTALEIPLRVLESEHPIPLNWQNEPASYVITATDLAQIQAELSHMQEVLKLLGFDTEVGISRIASGSIEMVLLAVGVAFNGVQAAIGLLTYLKVSKQDIEEAEQGFREATNPDKVSADECRAAAKAQIRLRFWRRSGFSAQLSAKIERENKSGLTMPDAQTHINKAVDKMMDSDGVNGQWVLHHIGADGSSLDVLGGDLAKLTPAQILALNPAHQQDNQESENA